MPVSCGQKTRYSRATCSARGGLWYRSSHLETRSVKEALSEATCGPTYRKCAEPASPQRQGVAWWLPQTGEFGLSEERPERVEGSLSWC